MSAQEINSEMVKAYRMARVLRDVCDKELTINPSIRDDAAIDAAALLTAVTLVLWRIDMLDDRLRAIDARLQAQEWGR